MDAVTMERGRATQGANLCSRLVYRSRATKALDGAGLADLVEAAQARNARENVTGCLVYDSGHFLQWLEGPGDGIDRIASSIRMDKRHDDIEVLDEAWTEKRVFSDWSMRLVVGHGVNDMNGAVAASDALIERLHRPPNPIQDLAELLRPHPLCGTALRDCREEAFNHGRLRERRGLMVRPKLVTADNVATAKAVDGALGGDVDRVCEALRPRIFESCLAARTVAQLLECVMEAIRIKWLDDAIWEYEATLAQCTALTAFRRMAFNAFDHPVPIRKPILVATAPCEQHLLQTAMASEALAEVGFDATCDHPETVEQLEELVRGICPSVVVLCLSGLFRRDERVQELESTVVRARRASEGGPLSFAVLGRSFSDDAAGPGIKGAECTCRSTHGLLRRVCAMDHAANRPKRVLPNSSTLFNS